jgi:hypothetical protein
MNWDHKADHDLLTSMVQELQPSQEQLRGVMNRMHGLGYTCTVKAITYLLPTLSSSAQLSFCFCLIFAAFSFFIHPSHFSEEPRFLLTFSLSYSQHLQKLRKKEGGSGAGSAKEDGAGPSTPKSTPKTPGGRKKPAGSAKGTPGSAKRKKAVVAESTTDDDTSERDAKKVKEEEKDVKQEVNSDE